MRMKLIRYSIRFLPESFQSSNLCILTMIFRYKAYSAAFDGFGTTDIDANSREEADEKARAYNREQEIEVKGMCNAIVIEDATLIEE